MSSPVPLARMTSLSMARAPISNCCFKTPPNPIATTPCSQVATARSGTEVPSASAHAASHPASRRPLNAPYPMQAQLASNTRVSSRWTAISADACHLRPEAR